MGRKWFGGLFISGMAAMPWKDEATYVRELAPEAPRALVRTDRKLLRVEAFVE